MGLFRHPSYLAWLALAAIGTIALGLWSENRRRGLAAAFADPRILARLYPQDALKHRQTKYLLKTGALLCVLLALAGPQWGVEMTATQAKGTQAVIAIDTSLSMLAEDIKPSRMEAAKRELSQLIDALQGQRIGLIAFAADAFIQCPMTTDFDAVKSFLRRVSAGMVSPPGTAIGKALELGASMLRKYPGQKAIVLLTDGEDHAGRTLEAARAAAEAGIHIYIIGIGTLEGSPIPIKNGQGRITGYKKDSKGQTVVTHLVENGLVQIAATASGAYYRATGAESEAAEIAAHILGMEKSELGGGSMKNYRNRYRIPLSLAFLLLLAELLLPEMKNAGPAGQGGLTGKLAQRLPLALLVLLTSAWSWPSGYTLWKGNSRYRKGDYAEALKEYQDAAQKRPNDPAPAFNSGAALYKMENYDEAGKAFESLSDPAKTPALAAKSLYNMGNAFYRKQQFKEAAQAYKQCLLLDPNQEDCRYNLVLALKPPPESKNKNQNKNQDKQNQDKDKKNQNNPDKSRQRPPQSQPRPDSGQGLSREDAERILSAIKEKERAADKNMAAQPQGEKQPGAPEEDW